MPAIPILILPVVSRTMMAPQGIQVTLLRAVRVVLHYIPTMFIMTEPNRLTAGRAISCRRRRPHPLLHSTASNKSFNISFPVVVYADPYTSPALTYGTVTTYQYLLPTGWTLGSATSDGSTLDTRFFQRHCHLRSVPWRWRCDQGACCKWLQFVFDARPSSLYQYFEACPCVVRQRTA